MDSPAQEKNIMNEKLLDHELLDRTATLLEMMEHLLRWHPSLQKDDLEQYYDDAYDGLMKLYQRISSLDVDIQNKID